MLLDKICWMCWILSFFFEKNNQTTISLSLSAPKKQHDTKPKSPACCRLPGGREGPPRAWDWKKCESGVPRFKFRLVRGGQTKIITPLEIILQDGWRMQVTRGVTYIIMNPLSCRHQKGKLKPWNIYVLSPKVRYTPKLLKFLLLKLSSWAD